MQLAFAHGTELRLSLLIIWSGFSLAVAAPLLPIVVVVVVVPLFHVLVVVVVVAFSR